MHLYQVRRLITSLTVIGTLAVLLIVWLGHLCLYPPGEISSDNASTLIATIVQTTAELGGAALAVVFLSAQLWAAAGRPSILRELYRSKDIYILLTYLSLTLWAGYVALTVITNPLVNISKCKIIDSLIVLAVASVLLIVPVVFSQIENLNQTALAAKLSARLKPKGIIDYGLTSVEPMPGQPNAIKYSLIMVGLRPSGVDPLRPLHELLMDAVNTRDRVLFGKLFRYLLAPIAKVYGGYWDLRGVKVNGSPGITAKLSSRRYRLNEKIHLSLGILHYSVKRARNLLIEWEGRDIGRHGIITGIGDLIRCLAKIKDSDTSIRICLYATLNITKYYSGVRPYGRIEPMNAYFKAAEELWAAGKEREAILCAEILGWTATHTEQLGLERAGNLEDIFNTELHQAYTNAKEIAKNQLDWVPGSQEEDPWRDWPPQAEKGMATDHSTTQHEEHQATHHVTQPMTREHNVGDLIKGSPISYLADNENCCPKCGGETVIVKFRNQGNKRAQAIHKTDIRTLEPDVHLIDGYSLSYRQKLLRALGRTCQAIPTSPSNSDLDESK